MRKYRNFRKMLKPTVIDRTNHINRIIRESINESFESIIPTEYEIIKENTIIIYRFKTSNDYSYDLEFIEDVMECDFNLNDNIKLGDIVECFNVLGRNYIQTTDLAFVPSEINTDDSENSELYSKETGRGEQFELMGRLSFLVKEYIKNNEYVDVFVIGKNTKDMKLKIYEKMFDNIFSDKFLKYEGNNPDYPIFGCFYFIKK